MNVCFIKHHKEDDPGLLGEAFLARGASLSVCNLPAGDPLLDPKSVDVGVILGSKWSVYQRETISPWIDAEFEWIRELDRQEIPLLGICFGAQAITVALGGVVERGPAYELGWTKVSSNSDAVASGPWFQFHGDRCLPNEEAEILATNDVCIQAFRIRRNLCVQFHPEIEIEQLERWMNYGGAEVAQGLGLDVPALLEETRCIARENLPRIDALVDDLLGVPSHP